MQVAGREEGVRALPYFWAEGSPSLGHSSFVLYITCFLTVQSIVFRFFQVVFSMFSASFQVQYSENARTIFNFERVQMHLTEAVF